MSRENVTAVNLVQAPTFSRHTNFPFQIYAFGCSISEKFLNATPKCLVWTRSLEIISKRIHVSNTFGKLDSHVGKVLTSKYASIGPYLVFGFLGLVGWSPSIVCGSLLTKEKQ